MSLGCSVGEGRPSTVPIVLTIGLASGAAPTVAGRQLGYYELVAQVLPVLVLAIVVEFRTGRVHESLPPLIVPVLVTVSMAVMTLGELAALAMVYSGQLVDVLQAFVDAATTWALVMVVLSPAYALYHSLPVDHPHRTRRLVTLATVTLVFGLTATAIIGFAGQAA